MNVSLMNYLKSKYTGTVKTVPPFHYLQDKNKAKGGVTCR